MQMNERQMREHVIGLVRDVVGSKGLSICPTWQDTIRALDLPWPIRADLKVQDGARDDRQVIVSSRLSCPERIVFTIFHEVLHILIDDDGEIPSELHDHFYAAEGEDAENRMLESLCNTGAAEFVMPLESFLPIMRDANWRIANLRMVLDRFNCSGVAAGFQYALNHPKDCVLVICEHGLHPHVADRSLGRGVETGHVLYASYVVAGVNYRYPMTRYATVPPTHIIHKTWLTRSDSEGRDHGFYQTSRKWPIPCEVTCLKDKAYAAFLPDGNVPLKYHASQPALY